MSDHAEDPTTALVPAAPHHVPAISFPGRGLPTEAGLFWSMFSARYLDPIPYDQADVDRIQELSRKGTVVYTHRSANWVDTLFMQRTVLKHGLPNAEFVAGFDARMFHPVSMPTWFRRGNEVGAPVDPMARDEWRLEMTLLQQKSALVFLKHPSTLFNPRPQEQAHWTRAIIRAQRHMDRPIFMVPQVINWIHRPGHFQPTLGDVVFGTSDSPGALRALGIAWLLYRWAKVRVANPVNVQEFLDHFPRLSDDVLARKLRFLLVYGLSREQQILNGPALKTHERLKEETLRDPRLKAALVKVAEEEKKPVEVMTARAGQQYDEVASRFDVDVMSVVDWFLRIVWNRIYDGMEVDPADIEKVRRTARKASLILVPSHRSHVDYLVLGQVLYWNAMMPPLVAAGINLSFWPVGPIFRRAGAFFIRRSFKGDAVYPHVVRTYMKHMLKEGFTQEFFIEGGRSRTGKTLQPKLGMVSMFVDAFLDGAQRDVAFVPVHIGYEKIVESRSYARELAGGEKVAENYKSLLSAGSVLRHKYGRVYVTFDEPILLRSFLQERGIQTEGQDNPPDAVRSAVRALSHRIVYGINMASVVTPTSVAALALLGHHRRGLSHRTLLRYARRILDHIAVVTDGAARVSPVLKTDLEGALREAMTRLADEGLVEEGGASGEIFYRAADSGRILLDYYKNAILHFFVPDAIVATAIRSFGGEPGAPVPLEELKHRAQSLSRLLKLEFQFRVGVRFDVLFGEALERSSKTGYVTVSDAGVALRPEPLAQESGAFVANVLANFVEGYAVGLQSLEKAMETPRTKKDLVAYLLDSARASFLAGECTKSEAVNKAIMENVVELALDQQLIEPGQASTAPMVATAQLKERLAAILKDVHALLRGVPSRH